VEFMVEIKAEAFAQSSPRLNFLNRFSTPYCCLDDSKQLFFLIFKRIRQKHFRNYTEIFITGITGASGAILTGKVEPPPPGKGNDHWRQKTEETVHSKVNSAF
jgi:hypothetical protein